MQEIWNRTPINSQRRAIPCLRMMRCVLVNHPQALLLVQGTSGGKSDVTQTVSIVDCGVTLVIEETLALSEDQKSKIKSASNAHSPVLAYQLDLLKQNYLITKLHNKLLQLDKNINCSIFLYTSPECLMRQPWQSLMVILLNIGVLKLVYVDKTHFFVMFGITFRN